MPYATTNSVLAALALVADLATLVVWLAFISTRLRRRPAAMAACPPASHAACPRKRVDRRCLLHVCEPVSSVR